MRVVSLFLLLFSCGASSAETLVQPGDVLQISIAEEPSIGREAKVNAEGRIMLPQLGGIDVADTGLDTIRQRIEQALTERDIVRRPNVVVEMASYRPVYVGGSVVSPGVVAFAPGMTVRHILLLAGGVSGVDGGGRPPTAELLALMAKWRTNAAELLQCESTIARLKAELAHSPTADVTVVDRRFVPAPEADTILQIDQDVLTAKLDAWSAEQNHLRELLQLIDFELDVLAKQAVHQQQEQDLQRTQIDNARKLFDQGLIPLPRLQELERADSGISRDLLENQAFAARARQAAANTKFAIESADTHRRIEVQGELAKAFADRIRLKAETEVLGAALLTAGISLGADGSAIARPEPEVTIHRSTRGRQESLRVQMDSEVRPGDLLDVAIAAPPNG